MKGEGADSRGEGREARREGLAENERAGLRGSLRQHSFALLIILLLATTLFAPSLVQREVFTLRDHFDYFQPLRWFTAQELAAGRLPLWNPWSASGEPWMANPQTGVFYPPAWLFVALPFATAYMLFLLLHLAILGFNAYLLFSRRASQGAALAGAIALMFSGPVLSLLDISTNLATLAWIPLALWCAAEGAWRRGALALALAFLGGEPFFATLGAALYVVRVLASSGGVLPAVRHIALAGSCAFGIAAVQLLPFVEWVATSDRAGGGMARAQILRDSMPLADWPRVALPLGGTLGQQYLPVIYVGVVVVALALVGLTRRRRDVAGWLALMIFAGVVAAGPAMLARLPVTLFRYPSRMLAFVALATVALAVIGWERVRPQKRWVDLVLMLVLVADLLPRAKPLLVTAPFRTDVVPWSKEIGTFGKVLRFGDVDPAQRALWMSGYLNLYERRFDAYTAAPLTTAAYAEMHRELLRKPTFESFAYAGVVHILTPFALPKPWFPVEQHGALYAFRNLDAYPMAAHFAPQSPSLRRATWSLDTSRAKVTVNAPRDGVLVLRQQAARGWNVTVDGRDAEPLLIDGIFRGVNVKKGRHEVVWTYDPPSFWIGLAMTCVTLAAMQISIFVKRSR